MRAIVASNGERRQCSYTYTHTHKYSLVFTKKSLDEAQSPED